MATKTVLFLTNKELGQATIVLTVAHELLIRQSYAVHIASFPQLQKIVSQLNSQVAALTQSTPTTEAVFHSLPGRCMVDAATATHPLCDSFGAHQIGFFGALDSYAKLWDFMAPWTGDEYVAIYQKCVEIIKQVQPSIVVVEPLLAQGFDACRRLGCKYAVLSPNTPKDHVMQPMLGNLWKYPILCSGYPFPVPWKYVIPNACLAIHAGITMATSRTIKAINDRRHAEGIEGPYPVMTTTEENPAPILIASHAETDFPCFVPDHITRCGPILRPHGPISEESPELAKWLSQRPTVLVNLGSNVSFNSEQARKLAHGLRILLDARSDIQVLWKLKADRDKEDVDWIPTSLKSIFDEVTAGRVRVEEWLPVEPICILQSGHVCCMVHHGGANSYNEAVRAGVPQIVLPVWFDTFDYAARVEYLGVGIWGSKKTAPAINGPELGDTFLRILHGDESSTMQEKAKAIASKIGSAEGRVVACEKLIELMQA